MNKNCEIARDLMPLVVDNAASDGSKEFVQEHVESCCDCKEIFCEMRREPPIPAPEKEKSEAFSRSVGKIKARIWRRRVIAFILAALVIAGAVYNFNNYYLWNKHVKPADEISAQMIRTPSRQVMVYLSSADGGNVIDTTAGSKYSLIDDDSYRLTITAQEPIVDWLYWSWYKLPQSTTYGYNYMDYSSLCLIDTCVYNIDVWNSINDILIVEDSSGEKKVQYRMDWNAPRRIDEIIYKGAQTPIYVSGDEIPVVRYPEFEEIMHSCAVGITKSESFESCDDYFYKLASDWVRAKGDVNKLPGIPFESLADYIEDLYENQSTQFKIPDFQNFIALEGELLLTIHLPDGSKISKTLPVLKDAE